MEEVKIIINDYEISNSNMESDYLYFIDGE